MPISISTINHLAQLARLDLTEAEKKNYQKDIASILVYVDKIQSLKVDLSHPLIFSESQNPVPLCRIDEIRESPKEVKQVIISSFPNKEGDLNKVKAVFGE